MKINKNYSIFKMVSSTGIKTDKSNFYQSKPQNGTDSYKNS